MIIDFVVPHLNNKNTEKSLKSLRRNTLPKNVGKVILVDQNPKYKDYGELVDYHIRSDQLGFAKACNTGIRFSDNDYVMCVNDDVEFLNPLWVGGIEETFKRYNNALGVNPSSPRNPGSPGGECVEEWEYKEDLTDEEYKTMVKQLGKGTIIDGICTWGTVFDRYKLEMVKGTLVAKGWFDELFFPGGGEDYDLNRRAYLSGYRMLGTGLSYCWHWWYQSNKDNCNWNNQFKEKWKTEDCDEPDIFGNKGLKEVPENIIK